MDKGIGRIVVHFFPGKVTFTAIKPDGSTQCESTLVYTPEDAPPEFILNPMLQAIRNNRANRGERDASPNIIDVQEIGADA